MAVMALRGRPMRFLAAGAINTAFGVGFYPLLVWGVPLFHRHYLLALAVAQVVSLIFAFTTHKIGVFRTRGDIVREFGAFSSFYLVNYAVNWLALPLLVELGRIPPAIAQIGFTVLTVVGSWFWHTRVTFRPRGGAQ